MPNDLPDKPEEGDTKNAISGQAVDPPTRLHRVPADEESGLPAKTPPNLASGTNRDSPPISSCAPALHGDVAGYEILAELGRGGMGVVYKARHRGLNRIVALKMILAGGHASEVDLKRFVAEAEAVAALQHQNIVQVYEIGQHNALPYMALEYVGAAPWRNGSKDPPCRRARPPAWCCNLHREWTLPTRPESCTAI